METDLNKCKKHIHAHLSLLKGNEKTSFAAYARANKAFIVANATPEMSSERSWANLFGNVADELGVELKREAVCWDSILPTTPKEEHLVTGANQATTPSPIESSGKSTQSAPRKLSIANKEFVRNAYHNVRHQKWTLSTGTVVEDVMLQYAMKSSFEHPSHSMILDPDDKCWQGLFTVAELQEIKTLNPPTLAPFPEELGGYLNQYKSQKELETLTEQHMTNIFHPTKQPDLHWVNKSIGEALDLFHYKYQTEGKTENDLLKRIWIFIDKCFDESVFTVRSGEKASNSSSERKNETRSLSGDVPLSRKLIGHKVDILISYFDTEYACAEAGLEGGTVSTKWIQEANIKVPKLLKDMLYKMSKTSPAAMKNIHVPGFVINGTSMAVRVASIPQGNVCRVLTLGPMEFPRTVEVFYKLMVPLLVVTWQVKSMVKSTLSAIENDDTVFVPTFETPTKSPFVTPSMPSPELQSRKRKQPDSDD